MGMRIHKADLDLSSGRKIIETSNGVRIDQPYHSKTNYTTCDGRPLLPTPWQSPSHDRLPKLEWITSSITTIFQLLGSVIQSRSTIKYRKYKTPNSVKSIRHHKVKPVNLVRRIEEISDKDQ